MDCLNPSEKSHEPTLLGGSPATNTKSRRSWHWVATSLLGLLSLILLALIIWLAVEVQHNRDAIHALQKSYTTAAQSGEVIRSAGGGTGGSTSLNTVAATYPAAYLSTNATASAGYAFSGSLYRSDFLVRHNLQSSSYRTLCLQAFAVVRKNIQEKKLCSNLCLPYATSTQVAA